MLWLVVLFRLLCPFTFYSEFGIVPEKDDSISLVTEQNMSTETLVSRSEKISVLSSPEVINIASSPNFTGFLGYIWFFVAISLILYNLNAYHNLKKRLEKSINLNDIIYINDEIESPFVFGVFKPRIYLPTYLSDDERDHVIHHEKTHIKRFDHFTRFIAFIAVSIHWFNPLVWLSYRLSEIDMEMSCDEAVINNIGNDIKKMYSRSLLSITTGKRNLKASLPLPFGSSDTKKRVKNVLNYRKPTMVYTLVLLTIIGATIICFGANNNHIRINTEFRDSTRNVSDIYQYKTKYIGDNSKVGSIIYQLSFPEVFTYKKFNLKTSEKPFGLIIEFEIDDELGKELKNELNDPILYKNALLIFSLVENCDYIMYSIDVGDESPYLLEYNIDWARKVVGEEPWLRSSSEESFNAYYEYVLSLYFIEGTSKVDSEEKVFKTYKSIEEVRDDYVNSEISTGVELGNRYYTDIYGETRFSIIRVISDNGNTSDFTLYFDTRNNIIWSSLKHISGPEYEYKDLIKLIDRDSFNSMFK
jgi:beta-lactamase regulating signal transducer with metallopeptidase domain